LVFHCFILLSCQIANVLERLLVKENSIIVRKVGYEMLLKFLEDLETPDPNYLQLIATGIDFTPFLTVSHANAVLPNKPLSGNLLHLQLIIINWI
jgi:hypothetical protein